MKMITVFKMTAIECITTACCICMHDFVIFSILIPNFTVDFSSSLHWHCIVQVFWWHVITSTINPSSITFTMSSSVRKASVRKRPRPNGNDGSNTSHNTPNDDNASNVRVCIRVRPMNHAERENQSSKNVVRVLNENILTFDPKEEESPSYFRGRRQRRNIMKKKARDMQFAFDHVFDSDQRQQTVYEHTTKSIIDCLMNGYNCSGRFRVYINSSTLCGNVRVSHNGQW